MGNQLLDAGYGVDFAISEMNALGEVYFDMLDSIAPVSELVQ